MVLHACVVLDELRMPSTRHSSMGLAHLLFMLHFCMQGCVGPKLNGRYFCPSSVLLSDSPWF